MQIPGYREEAQRSHVLHTVSGQSFWVEEEYKPWVWWGLLVVWVEKVDVSLQSEA